MPQNQILTKVGGPWGSLLAIVAITAVVIVAKELLLPLALGLILAFLLTPLVRLFDRMRLPRFLSVILTMSLALGAVGAIGYVTWIQFAELSTQVTQYTSSMRRKVADLKLGNDAALQQLTRTVDKVTEQLDGNLADQRRAQPVRVVPPRLTTTERLHNTIEGVFEPIASAFIVLVLVMFMLGQREDLRDRFIRLIGASNVTITTRLMDEAAQRVSRFIIAQLLVNIVFGAIIAAGLYWIGVPYAALWGGLTALLRFVPYVGTMLSAFMPALLAFAIFPGWTETLQTLGMFLVLDIIAAYFAEPVVFGHRTGVSSFALLISALFWIWVWGPVGLLLATPLTVCIAVLGRHVRSLRFLAILFADEPALQPHVRYYQRLLARDEDEAHAVVNRKVTEVAATGAMDEVLIPALALAVQHRSQNDITDDDYNFILEATSDIVQQFRPARTANDEALLPIVGLATRTPVDQVLLEMLGLAINSTEMRFRPIGTDADGRSGLQRAIELHPDLVCVVSLSPTRGSEVRSYCRQLRAEKPDIRLLVLRPNVADPDVSRSAARIKEAGADCVATNIAEALQGIERMCPACPPLEGAEPDVITLSSNEEPATNDDQTLGDRTFVPVR
ncbi:MAG TPA: AI-2E family transporter [Steroidobacteraceae bacterium]|nr:AI-2E family transporter [Steroidobacteraceae bacterium]